MQKVKCNFCGAEILSTDEKCTNCGAINQNYVRTSADTPKTIEELKAWCDERGIKLDKLHMHIGEDYKKPKAFGIYKKDNEFIVYKNKDTGQRAIRYQGPDEEFAVNELFLKIKEMMIDVRSKYPRQDTHNPQQVFVPLKEETPPKKYSGSRPLSDVEKAQHFSDLHLAKEQEKKSGYSSLYNAQQGNSPLTAENLPKIEDTKDLMYNPDDLNFDDVPEYHEFKSIPPEKPKGLNRFEKEELGVWIIYVIVMVVLICGWLFIPHPTTYNDDTGSWNWATSFSIDDDGHPYIANNWFHEDSGWDNNDWDSDWDDDDYDWDSGYDGYDAGDDYDWGSDW